MKKEFDLYEGNKPYIFVSYCHKDKEKVFPVIARLMGEGFRVWFDEGIHPGSQWPEIVAERLEHSSVFMVFLSDAYSQSQNCIREIHFAVSRNKSMLSVILEPVRLTPGVEMQLCVSQAIRSYSYRNPSQFYRDLLRSSVLECCRQDVKPEETVSGQILQTEEEAKTEEKNSRPVKDKKTAIEKNPVSKRKDSKKRKKRILVLAAAGIVIAACIAAAAGFQKANTVTIAGTEYSRDQNIVTFEDQEITADLLEQMEPMRALSGVNFKNCSFKDQALSELYTYGNLTNLSFESCEPIEDYSFLNDFSSLYHLSIVDCGLKDGQIRLEQSMETLASVDISDNPAFSDLGWLSKVPSVSTLRLHGNGIQDADIVSDLTELSTLDLSGNQLRAIKKPMKSLRLSQADLGGNQIRDLSGLSDLTVLRKFSLKDNQYKSEGDRYPLEFLAKSSKTLVLADLSGNGFTGEEVSSMLAGCSGLKEVYLSRNPKLGTVSFLQSAVELEVLTASGCGISDLSGLAACENLKIIDLSGNELASLEGFPALESVESLRCNLSDNALTSLRGLATAPKYRELLLYGNFLDPETCKEILAKCEGNSLEISYITGMEPKDFSGFSAVYVPELPADQKVAWEDIGGMYCFYERFDASSYERT